VLPTGATAINNQVKPVTRIIVVSLLKPVVVKAMSLCIAVVVVTTELLLVLVIAAVLVDVMEVVVGCNGTKCSGSTVIAPAPKCSGLLPRTAMVEFTSVSRKASL